MFVINKVDDDETGNHSKAIHSVHNNGAIEKGFLMVVLAFVYWKKGFLHDSPSPTRHPTNETLDGVPHRETESFTLSRLLLCMTGWT